MPAEGAAGGADEGAEDGGDGAGGVAEAGVAVDELGRVAGAELGAGNRLRLVGPDLERRPRELRQVHLRARRRRRERRRQCYHRHRYELDGRRYCRRGGGRRGQGGHHRRGVRGSHTSK